MALSASYSFASGVTRDDIISFALRKIGVRKRGMTMSAEDVSDAAFSLNLILIGIRENSDTSHSVKMWLRKRIRIFLEDGKDTYDTSDSTDHIVDDDDLISATASFDYAAGWIGAMTISSIAGMNVSDVVGFVQTDGTMHWSTLSAVGGSQITPAVGPPIGIAAGSAVYVYTANCQPPVSILTSRLRYESGAEADMYPMRLEDYDSIYDKSVSGTPVSIYYERRRAAGVFYLDVNADDDTQQALMTVRYPLQDVTAAGDNIDVDSQWLRYVGWKLAIDIAPEHGVSLDPSWESNMIDAYVTATKSDPETSDLCFEPGRD